MARAKPAPRIEAVYRGSAPWPRFLEAGPALGLALFVFWKTRSFAAVWPCYAYVGYLLLDLLAVPQRRLTKRVRNGSAAVFTLAYLWWVLPLLGLPRPSAPGSLAAVLAGAAAPYFRERGRTALGFARGLVAAALLDLGALFFSPTPLGPPLALPLYAAVFAWEERTALWRCAAPACAGYACVVPLWLGGRLELLPHAIAALLAWAMTLVSDRPKTAADAEEASAPSTLGLRG